ncbi:MAG: DUF4328 domain-containing protein [Bacteroidales bacterium]|jgi:hypothetical protein|nr:DUF4328 domain-containing protein [Bacteroidales bacterium]
MNTILRICKQCTKREMDFNQGIVCSLTHEKSDFEDDCPNFVQDDTVPRIQELDLKSNAQRAKIAIALISTVLGLEFISLISSGMQYDLLQTISQGGQITNAVAEANDSREQIIAILYLATYIISGITFIRWFRRAYYNLHQKISHLSNTEGWAAGSWFVPILSLYMPYQIMKELYVETKKYLTAQNDTIDINLTPKFLGLWWTLWIANSIFGQIIYHFSKSADSLSELITFTTLGIVSSVIGIVLAIITIRIIKDYADVEELLHAKKLEIPVAE